jgi:hypothetical protein
MSAPRHLGARLRFDLFFAALLFVTTSWGVAQTPSVETSVRSLIRWSFTLSYPVDALLVRQALPSGLTVEPGSARLGDLELPDPRIAGDGSALWLLTPAGERFDLTFVVLSPDASGPLAPPDAVALAGPHEIPLAGELSFAVWYDLDDPNEEAPSAAPPPRSLVNVQAAAGVRGIGSDQPVAALGVRAYWEGELGENRWQLAIDRELQWSDEEGWSVDSGWNAAASDRLPLLGSDAVATNALRSVDGVAFRYERPGLSADYLAGEAGVPGVDGSFRADAARVDLELAPGISVAGFAARVAPDLIRETILPDGTRSYPLVATPTPGSERVVRIERDEAGETVGEVTLELDRDYTIDRLTGMLVLARPEWATSLRGHQVRLEVQYTAPDAPRSELAAGVGARYVVDDWRVEVGVAHMPHAGGGLATRFGVRAEQASGWTLNLQHIRPAARPAETRWRLASGSQAWGGGVGSLTLAGWGGAARRGELHLTMAWPDLRLAFDSTLALAEGRSGNFSVNARYAIDEQLEIRVGAARADDQTSVALGAGYADGGMAIAGDLRYTPASGALQAVASVTATLEDVALTLSQEATLVGDAPSVTQLRATTSVGEGTLQAEVRHLHGGETRTTVGLAQSLGNAEVRAELSAPLDTEGDGHLRFGVRLPWLGVAGLRLEADIGVDGQLWDREVGYAASLVAAYTRPAWAARLAVDVAWRDLWKALVAAQVGGSFGGSLPQQLEVDLRWALAPDWRLWLAASYALHASDWSLLAYQRLAVEGAGWSQILDGIGRTELEGEFAASWRALDALRLRPAFAYRYDSDDTDSLVMQAGFGMMLYPMQRLGFGAVVYHSWQPTLDINATAFGAEASVGLTEAFSVVAGYTGGVGPSLLPGSAGGWHLRFEVYGGTP